MTPEDKKTNFFIIGAAKAGTTSLYDILNQHPQVYFSFDKEPAYFCDEDYFKRGEEWYLKTFFRDSQDQPVRGEATSRYLFFSEKVAPRIQSFTQPNSPKFIAIFRDPAQLVYSFYWHSVREGHETLSFPAALHAEPERMKQMKTQLENRGQILFAYSRVGAYASQITKYLAIFPKEKFLFLLTEDLSNFSALINNLQIFLALADHSSHIKYIKSNNSALPGNKTLHQWLRNRSVIKDILKLFIPFRIRYRIKMSAINTNLSGYTPPALDEEMANNIRKNYSEETKHLQDILQRDLSRWLPV